MSHMAPCCRAALWRALANLFLPNSFCQPLFANRSPVKGLGLCDTVNHLPPDAVLALGRGERLDALLGESLCFLGIGLVLARNGRRSSAKQAPRKKKSTKRESIVRKLERTSVAIVRKQDTPREPSA